MRQTDFSHQDNRTVTAGGAAIDPEDMPLFHEFQAVIQEISQALTSEMLGRLQRSVENWQQEIELRRHEALQRLETELAAGMESGLKRLPKHLDEAAGQVREAVKVLQSELRGAVPMAMRPLEEATQDLAAVVTRSREEFQRLLAPVLEELKRLEQQAKESAGSLARQLESGMEQRQRAEQSLAQQGGALKADIEAVRQASAQQAMQLNAKVVEERKCLESRIAQSEQTLRGDAERARRQLSAIESQLAAAQRERQQLATDEGVQFQSVTTALNGLQEQLQGLARQQEEMLGRQRRQAVVLWVLGIAMVLLEVTHWLGLGLHR